MSTWKKILTTDDQTNNNIGSSDLTITAGADRRLIFPNASTTFAVKNSSNNLVFKCTHTVVTVGSTVNTTGVNLNTSEGTFTLAANIAAFADTNTFLIRSESTGASAGPTLELHRNNSAPADDDLMGQINFTGESNTSATVTYAQIICKNEDVTNSSPDGELQFLVRKGSTGMHEAVNIDGTNLDLSLEMRGSDLTVKSIETGSSASPSIVLERDHQMSDNEIVSDIQSTFLNTAGSEKVASKLQTVVSDVSNTEEDASFSISTIEAGTVTSNLSLGPRAGISDSITENQRKLKSASIYGSDLDALTNKFMHTFMFGSGLNASNTEGSANTIHILRTVNGINMGDYADSPPTLDDDGNNMNGIILPFNAHLRGGSVSYRKAGGNQADVTLKVRVYDKDTTTQFNDYSLAAISGTSANKNFPRGVGLEPIFSGTGPSGNIVNTNNFEAGSKVVVYLEIDSTSSSTTYTVDDVIAAVSFYSEDFG